jgi:hypothetical protein
MTPALLTASPTFTAFDHWSAIRHEGTQTQTWSLSIFYVFSLNII